MRLKGKLVTTAASGIGEGIAKLQNRARRNMLVQLC
jgi:hypothetical protein